MLLVLLVSISFTWTYTHGFVAMPKFKPPPENEADSKDLPKTAGSWGPWSPCSRTCGGGAQARSWICDKSKSNNCDIRAPQQTRDCNDFPCCAKKPILKPWGSWNRCPLTCGEGIVFRVRRCEFFDCLGGPSLCNAHLQETKTCDAGCCPIQPIWKEWGDWTRCSCINGKPLKVRKRECQVDDCPKSPKACIGDSEQTEKCSKKCRDKAKPTPRPPPTQKTTPSPPQTEKTTPSTVAPTPPPTKRPPRPSGGKASWSEWSEWSRCSVTCGKGTKMRQRKCKGGKKKRCKGDRKEEMNCDAGCCEASEWLPWKDWSKCSVTCGGGEQERRRDCHKPCSDSGQCQGGSDKQTRSCNTQDCDRCEGESEWNQWNTWGECSAPCGGGKQDRRRDCNEPCPDSNPCKGPDKDTRSCNNKECCDGASKWLPWTDWSKCSASCGGGEQERRRDCHKPCPDSVPCQGGSDKETRLCNNDKCPTSPGNSECKGKKARISNWNSWGEWSVCSVTCGGGSTKRSRSCNRSPCPGSKDCKGQGKDEENCNMQGCDGEAPCDNPEWGEWAEWGSCCNGSKERKRICVLPAHCSQYIAQCLVDGGIKKTSDRQPTFCTGRSKNKDC